MTIASRKIVVDWKHKSRRMLHMEIGLRLTLISGEAVSATRTRADAEPIASGFRTIVYSSSRDASKVSMLVSAVKVDHMRGNLLATRLPLSPEHWNLEKMCLVTHTLRHLAVAATDSWSLCAGEECGLFRSRSRAVSSWRRDVDRTCRAKLQRISFPNGPGYCRPVLRLFLPI